MKNITSSKLRDLVGNNKLNEAIEEILELYGSSQKERKIFSNEGLLLKQQLTSWNEQFIRGQEPAQKEKARIAYSILLIADNLDSNSNLDINTIILNEQEASSIKENSWSKRIIYILSVALIILITFNFISSYFHYKQMNAIEKQLKNSDRELVYAEISEILGTRLFRTLKQIDFYIDPKLPEEQYIARRAQLLEKYSNIIDEWNSNLPKNSNILEFKFNKIFRIKFDDIHVKFKEYHADLRKAINYDGTKPDDFNIEDLKSLHKTITDFATHNIEAFIIEMREFIQNNKS